MIVVVPPQAAARVPVSNVSDAYVPPNGSSMWVWPSTPPGHDVLAGRVDHAGRRVAARSAPDPPRSARPADDLLAVHQDVRRRDALTAATSVPAA